MLIYEIYLAEKLTKTFKDLIDQAVEEGLDYKILLLFLFYAFFKPSFEFRLILFIKLL